MKTVTRLTFLVLVAALLMSCGGAKETEVPPEATVAQAEPTKAPAEPTKEPAKEPVVDLGEAPEDENNIFATPAEYLAGGGRGGTTVGNGESPMIDVAVPEPLPEDSELWDLENLLITFHVAGGSQYESQFFYDLFVENLGRFVRGELPLRNQIDKRQGF